MQLEKTDGPTHPDDITGNDADAVRHPAAEKQRTMPRHAHARRGRETERRTDAPPFLIFF
ncbi:hypothetical protein [Bifidobacterium catenulatum]|uniref:hypothetical protein n=1 Tax=Bifidobacterium catenulatum TaxID=1686 RepID=UPI0032C01799